MAKAPNKELLKQTAFDTCYEDDVIVSKRYKSKKVPAKMTKAGEVKTDYEQKLNDAQFDEFTTSDWKKYFQKKAIDNGYYFRYDNHKESNFKECKIIEELQKEFSGEKIKQMMDFLWDAPHKLKPKGTIALYMLSGGWVRTVANLSKDWIEGEDKPQKTVREYKPDPRDKKPDESRVFLWGDM